jgi:two-component system sensor histidine kinase HydH
MSTEQPEHRATYKPHADSKWRFALLITTVILGAALLTSGADRYRAAVRSSHAITDAEVHAMLLGARRELLRSAGQQEEILTSIFEELRARGLLCLAIIEPSGKILFTLGTPQIPFRPPPLKREFQRGPPVIVTLKKGELVHAFVPLGRGHKRRINEKDGDTRSPMTLAVELAPRAANKIISSARLALFLEIGAAGVLLFATAIFWRLSRRAEKFSSEMEQERLETAMRLERDSHLKQLGQMSAVLGHELRNPLASLKGHAQLLNEKVEEGHPGKSQAQIVLDEVHKLEALTTQVLDFARTGELKLSRVYLDDLVHAAATFANADHVEIQVSEDLPPWKLDRSGMEQVLINLLTNARQASSPDNPVVLNVSARGDLQIEIRDSGEGIPPGQEEKIFEPFFTSRAQGTGLGLALARRIVERHGGSLTASNQPTGGAIFTILIPKELRETH